MALYDINRLTPPPPWNIRFVASAGSTNDILLASDAPHGTVLLAGQQTAGKGSRGRSFFSPEGGIYLSLLLRDLSRERLPLLTPMAAVALHRALRPHTKKSLAIKWVNDLYLDGGKLCGILTENRFSPEGCTTVVGIGINLVSPQGGFPDGFLHPPAALLSHPDPAVAEDIINRLLRELQALLAGQEFLSEYKTHCLTLGKTVTLKRGEEIVSGRAVDILPDGALLLDTVDGPRAFSSGEVTSQHKGESL